MKHNDVFSICIPTYNRVETLKETLPDLISKVKKHNIAIFISDNGSYDGTEQFILELIKDYKYIVYFKFDNIDADKNIIRALKLSNTKYSLLLGDHYILYDNNSIDIILSYIQQGKEFDAYVLHYKNRRMFHNNDYLYTDPNLFLEEMAWYIGMVATVIYSEKLIENCDFEKYYNTRFPQPLSILNYISQNQFQIQYIAEETIWNKKGGIKGSKSWHSDALEVFTKEWYEVIMTLPNIFTKESKERCIKNHSAYTIGFFSFNSMMLYHYAGGLSIFDIVKYFRYFYFICGFKTVLQGVFISVIPKSLIKYCFKDSYSYIKRILGEIDDYK